MENKDSNNAEKNSSVPRSESLKTSELNADSDDEAGGCDYQGYEFGAGSYPDSICIKGQLYDADDCDDQGRLYEPTEEIPCPVCCPADAIDYWTDRNRLGGASETAARAAAKSLVTDILNRRGLLVNTQDTNTLASSGTT